MELEARMREKQRRRRELMEQVFLFNFIFPLIFNSSLVGNFDDKFKCMIK